MAIPVSISVTPNDARAGGNVYVVVTLDEAVAGNTYVTLSRVEIPVTGGQPIFAAPGPMLYTAGEITKAMVLPVAGGTQGGEVVIWAGDSAGTEATTFRINP